MDAPSNNDAAYGYTAHLAEVLFADARARITEALKSEGFGIFTEIDVTATLKAKLNRDWIEGEDAGRTV